jgi:hypothetical protein
VAEEIAALEHTDTWDLILHAPSAVPVMCKWVYKTKTLSDDSIENYNARLVACGFYHEYGRDSEETFAPIAHRTAIHTLITVSPVCQWTISRLDVKNAFLHDDLHEEVYMHPPPGYSVPDGDVCHLCRSLCGLKQTPRALFEHFTSVVIADGFVASQHDSALFVHTSPCGRTLFFFMWMIFSS